MDSNAPTLLTPGHVVATARHAAPRQRRHPKQHPQAVDPPSRDARPASPEETPTDEAAPARDEDRPPPRGPHQHRHERGDRGTTCSSGATPRVLTEKYVEHLQTPAHKKRVTQTRRAIGQYLSDEGLRKDAFLLSELRRSATEPPSVALLVFLEAKRMKKTPPKLAVESLWREPEHATTAAADTTKPQSNGDDAAGAAATKAAYAFRVPPSWTPPPATTTNSVAAYPADGAPARPEKLDNAAPWEPHRWRIGRDFSAEMRALIAAAPHVDLGEAVASASAEARTIEARNLQPRHCADVRALFEPCGAVESSELGLDERGAMTRARVVFRDELGAITAVEKLNDAANWRFGLRVTLASGATPAHARRTAGLPPRAADDGAADAAPADGDHHHPAGSASSSTQQQPQKHAAQNNNNTNGDDDDGAAAARGDHAALPAKDAYDEQPDGRRRGRLAYLKPGKYGFVRPRDARSKEDNAFFLVSELSPRTLQVALGDWLEYTPDLVVDKNGEAKKQARRVTKCDPPPKPAVASRADKQRNTTTNGVKAAPAGDAPAGGGSTALARLCDALRENNGDAGDSTDAPTERPSRLRNFGLANKTQNHHHANNPAHSSDAAPPPRRVQERVAKGPDGTIGFTRPRTKLRVAAAAFVPLGGDQDGADEPQRLDDAAADGAPAPSEAAAAAV
mmetsp:Transcript_4042/g.16179  ORF Transcript_4042/g.16179 Transcript_4042/m.16179 type:complete len:680 (-) Transcript_4042:860-2899(-)